MARDECLLLRVGMSESPPTLRLYRWDPPTISLGYFQRYADYEALPPPAGMLPVVRRLTGGGAILHDLELTYSLTLATDDELLSDGCSRLYELAHEALIACLASLALTGTSPTFASPGQGAPARHQMANGERRIRSAATSKRHPPLCNQQSAPVDRRPRPGHRPFFCFDRRHRYDVLVGKDKIAGSAQRRKRDAVLQHGSIILASRYPQHATATTAVPFEEAVRRVHTTLPRHLEKVTGRKLRPGEWSAAELAAVDYLIPKYTGDAWTKRV